MFKRANAHTPLAQYVMEKIEDYNEQLKQLCPYCKRYEKCNHSKICAFKKLAWVMALRKLKKQTKECEKVECK